MSPSLMLTLSFFLRSTSTRSITTTMTSMTATRSPITAPTTAPVLSLLLPRSVVSVGRVGDDEDTGGCEVGSVGVVVAGGGCVVVGELMERTEVGGNVLLTMEGIIDPRGTEKVNYYRGIYTGNIAIDLRIFKVISGRPSIKSPDDGLMPPTDP